MLKSKPDETNGQNLKKNQVRNTKKNFTGRDSHNEIVNNRYGNSIGGGVIDNNNKENNAMSGIINTTIGNHISININENQNGTGTGNNNPSGVVSNGITGNVSLKDCSQPVTANQSKRDSGSSQRPV